MSALSQIISGVSRNRPDLRQSFGFAVRQLCWDSTYIGLKRDSFHAGMCLYAAQAGRFICALPCELQAVVGYSDDVKEKYVFIQFQMFLTLARKISA